MKTFAAMAQECADDAARAKRDFLRMYRFGMCLGIVMGIAAVTMACSAIATDKYTSLIGAALIAVSAVWVLSSALLCKKDASRFFNEYMTIRQDCLNSSRRFGKA